MNTFELRLFWGGQDLWFGGPGYYWTELRDTKGRLIEKKYLISCDKVKGSNGAWDLVFESFKNRKDWFIPAVTKF